MVQQDSKTLIRFGYGNGPKSGDLKPFDLLDPIDCTPNQQKYPFPSLDYGLSLAHQMITARRSMRNGTSDGDTKYMGLKDRVRESYGEVLSLSLARIADSENPFQERLMWFWAYHFTAVAKQFPAGGLIGSYLDDAICPHLNGRFPDMLKAAVTHPLMLTYLDQFSSVGPNSKIENRRGVGLNENLAREVLELHTLGVRGEYSQEDVRQLAELMTGLTVNSETGFEFRPEISEPGTKTILGHAYGGKRRRLGQVFAALEDIALRPETALHLAEKLYVHFISNRPNDALIEEMATRYSQSGGELSAMYQAMMEHEDSKIADFSGVKRPFEFIASTIVALGLSGERIRQLTSREQLRLFWRPLQAMGQPFMAPPGPDGWSEDPQTWITPQGLAARITWSIEIANLVQSQIKDPRDFLVSTLGDQAGQNLTAAVAAAENKATGIALVLASAEFNRR